MSETKFTKLIILVALILIMCSVIKSVGPLVAFIIGWVIGTTWGKIL